VLTPEQLERWHKRVCARCGSFRFFSSTWPDGPVCRTCEDRGLRARGPCPSCGQVRILPGLRPSDNAPICTGCARFRQSYACSRCSEEGKLHGRRLCTRCTFADRLTDLLDDGNGRIRPDLAPLFDLLIAMDNPMTGLLWASRKHTTPLLRGLAEGRIELTHEAFHQLHPWRSASHLHELLMACGLLPKTDKRICLFERWLDEHLATINDPAQAQIIRRYATWEILPGLRGRAGQRPITVASRRFAGERINRATEFLTWLSDQGLDLRDCRQAQIDRWHAQYTGHDRRALRGFLIWCANNKLTRPFDLPATSQSKAAPITAQQRLTLLGQLLTDHTAPARSRIAAILLLLYAQPISRLVRLTLDDVIHDDGQVFIRFGEPPTPVPEPFAVLLLDYLANRANMRTATNQASRWLFPGRRAGQPLHSGYLAQLVNALGVATIAGRTAALRQHVMNAPAPIVAQALGYHHITTTRHATEAGAKFNRYASGDHTQSPRPLPRRRTDDS
jgi:integrase